MKCPLILRVLQRQGFSTCLGLSEKAQLLFHLNSFLAYSPSIGF